MHRLPGRTSTVVASPRHALSRRKHVGLSRSPWVTALDEAPGQLQVKFCTCPDYRLPAGTLHTQGARVSWSIQELHLMIDASRCVRIVHPPSLSSRRIAIAGLVEQMYPPAPLSCLLERHPAWRSSLVLTSDICLPRKHQRKLRENTVRV